MPLATSLKAYFLLCITLALLLPAHRQRKPDEPSEPPERRDHISPSQTVLFEADPDQTNVKLPLRTRGRDIVDSSGKIVKLISVNWYGGSDVNFVPSGLDKQPRGEIAGLIRDLGFNSVRLPYSDEMVNKNPPIDPSFLAANLDLVDTGSNVTTALDVFAAVVESLTATGLMVIVNDHITQATWCCGANPCDGGWANDWLGGRWFCRIGQSQAQWIANWETVMRPFAQNELVIGADLRNEVRGLWGTMHWDRWANAAEVASERLLALNPHWLMIVEGISSANDLTSVRTRPIQLSVPDRVVYSAHVYWWSGWGSLRPFAFRTYESFAATMWANWAYLVGENLAPVWVGEMGTPDEPSQGDLNYWTHLIRFLREVDTGWGYWAINPRKPAGNESDRYGLVREDWKTVQWDFRLEDLRKLGLTPRIMPNGVEGTATLQDQLPVPGLEKRNS